MEKKMKDKKQQIKGRYLIFILILCISICVYGYLIYLNNTSPVIMAVEGYVDATKIEDTSIPHMLTGQWLRYKGLYTPEELSDVEGEYVRDIQYIRKMRGHTYTFSMKARVQDNFYFLLPRPHTSRLWINGQEVLGENGTSITPSDYFDLNSYSGNGDYSFTLQVSSNSYHNVYQGILVGSKEALSMTRNLWILLDAIAIGLSLMLILLCLTLYINKLSEIYLPLLALSALMELARFLLIPRLPMMIPFHLGSVAFYGQFTFVNYFICKLLVPRTASKNMDRMIYATIVISLLGCIFYPAYSGSILRYSYMVYIALQLYLLSKGVLKGKPESGILLLGCCIAMGSEIFYTLLDIGLIPQGVVDVQIFPAQYFRFFYLVAFAIATCKKFALKFSEADILSGNLERQVNEKTKELRASQESLISLQQKRQQFMTDMVHNLRSPLFALGGYVDLFRDKGESLTVEQEKYIDLIDRKIRYVGRMVDDMFLITRLEEGKIQFYFAEFEAAAFLEGALQDAKAKSVDKGVQVVCLHKLEGIIINGDPFRLRQALDNILDNAIRYSSEGSLVTIQGNLDSYDRVRISVTDTGSGIPEDKQAQLFKRYISRGEGGQTGLGLAIADYIVKEHQGSISVDSEQGKGSTFTIVLPRC
jgi:signal transduction histidine kinase